MIEARAQARAAHHPSAPGYEELDCTGRIIAAFATLISIMAVLGALSYVQLGDIRSEASLLESDVLPGLLISSQGNSQAKDLLAGVITQFAESDE